MSQREKKKEPDTSGTERLASIVSVPEEAWRPSGAMAALLVNEPATSHQSRLSLSIRADSGRSTCFTGDKKGKTPLYTPAQRLRRDASRWTLVQGVLAPVQFVICLVSVALVLRFLLTGEGYIAATASVVAKTFALYAIMITGSIWEKEVFGRYLFAPSFYWEDVVSMLVLGLHTAYLFTLITGALDPRARAFLALAAYATYIVNAVQFLLKLRAARLSGPQEDPDMVFAELAQ